MIGKLFLRDFRVMLNEESGSNLLDDFVTYGLLNEAAINLNDKIVHVTKDLSITTTADQSDYTLPGDFTRLYRLDNLGNHFITYSDGTTRSLIKEKDQDVAVRNRTTETVISVTIPNSFSIEDDDTLDSRVTGTATDVGAISSGESTLTDTAADFSDVSPGDIIDNATDGSMGVVLSKTSSTVLVTALFIGTANDWSINDTYTIQPEGRYKLILDPPPSNSSETIIVPYVANPDPVYSDFGTFRTPKKYDRALIFYAMWLFLYRADEPNKAAIYFQAYEQMVSRSTKHSNKALHNDRVVVNFKKRQRNY